MHKHTIDWYRQVLITADAGLAEKRWATAEALAKKLSRAKIIQLLRLFVFPPKDCDFTKAFTDEVLAVDGEFPVRDNSQELRLMAGLVMVTTFGGPSGAGDAFALGLRAADFPRGRVEPIQPEIVTEAEGHLRSKSDSVRPDAFKDGSMEVIRPLGDRAKEASEADAAGDEAKTIAARAAYWEAIQGAIARSHREHATRIEQLAEESGLLWWVLGEHSDTLEESVCNLKPEAYALVAGYEAARRTLRLPPPPSIKPLLARVLRSCADGPKKKLVLSDYAKATDPEWRATYLNSVAIADFHDLVPLHAAIDKVQELGDVGAALRALAKLCPGVKADLPVIPSDAAQQFYDEVIFARALDATSR